ncbi:MAG TPA: ATP-binding protein [Ktedonobacterales bacterium]|nr:ATP-binding protein [Ktedonobacterales bacterium]
MPQLPRALHLPFRLRSVPLGRLVSSVRVRMTLWYLAILALVFVVFGAIVSGIVVRDAQIAEENRLSMLSQQIAGTYDASSGNLHLDGLVPTTPMPPGGSNLKRGYLVGPEAIVLLVDARGAVTQTAGPLDDAATAQLQTLVIRNASDAARFGEAVEAFDAVSLPMANGLNQKFQMQDAYDVQYEVHITPVLSQGRQVATLVIGEPSNPNASLQALLPGLLVAGPATLLVAAIGGYWLATRAMRPVRLITQAAREIEESDLSRRLNMRSRDELGELAATFDDMLSRLEAAFARQRQFTADASHELRTPLAIVSLETRRALAGLRSPEDYERALATIQAECDFMSRLVNSLLTLARADAGQIGFERVEVDLSDVVLDAVERLAPLAREGHVELSVGELTELTVEGDPLSLTQMVGNLVENAIKHGRPGGHVRAECGAGDMERLGWAWVRVADDGPGIAGEHLPHLFDRFYRADEARGRGHPEPGPNGGAGPPVSAADGAGLGLAIVRWTAETHGGEVTVETVEGTGSTFTVWLPLAARRASVPASH